MRDFHRKTRMFHLAASQKRLPMRHALSPTPETSWPPSLVLKFYDVDLPPIRTTSSYIRGEGGLTLLDYFAFSAALSKDPRTIDWFLVRNPIYLVIIMMAYHYFIQYLGPKFMKDRNPLDLSRLIMIFNVTQIVYNVWMVNEMANVCWHYYMSKIMDLLDTIFFVLRKKNNQITPLHLLHHTGMPVISFICVRFYPGGHGTLTLLLNSFVHSIMYFYYLLAGLGPGFKKYLWWKHYLTLLQMYLYKLVTSLQ
uniref:Elongation of very long chain fatty acids protein n=1 Tax=Timema douglasi TaxID=61478 RepID=A0A7R8VHT5_TIMDO|nr:unnamed protein product [Timema douglasi]